MTAIALREMNAPAVGERFDLMAAEMRDALAEAKEPLDVRAVIDQAKVAEVYARAHLSAEHVLYAEEVRIWAFRRAGEIRAGLMHRGRTFDWAAAKKLRAEGLSKQEVGRRLGVTGAAVHGAELAGFVEAEGDPSMKKAEFDDLFGVTAHVAHTWQRVAAIPEAEMNAHIAEAKREGRLSLNAILVRSGHSKSEERVEPGIYRLATGLQIRWKKHNRVQKVMLDEDATVDDARRALEEVGAGKRTLSDALAETRRAAIIVSQLLTTASSDTKPYLGEAKGLLCKAAEVLARAAD